MPHKQKDLKLNAKTKFYNVPAPMTVMKQIRMGYGNLLEIDDLRHLKVCINYFRKWPVKKPVMNKKAALIVQFLCELMCTIGCVPKHIHNKGIANFIV